MPSQPDIPHERVAAFVRQHTHDLRNGLNSLDLETALLRELVSDAEAQAAVERLRRQLRGVAAQLRALSALFEEPQPMAAPIAAKELLLIWHEQHAAFVSAPETEWRDELEGENVNVDAEMMAAIFRELLANAAAFHQAGPAHVRAWREGEQAVFELREPKPSALDTAGWGQPFSSTRRAGYGLGLWAARRRAEANGATFTQRYLPEESALVTRIALPSVGAPDPCDRRGAPSPSSGR